MVHKDYYGILGLSDDAPAEAIKKAYRKLAMQYHPDRNGGREEWANDRFKEINEAFSVLGDPKKRIQYDHFGTEGNIGDIFNSQATRSTFEDLVKDFGGAGLGFDFLDNIFGDNFVSRGFAFHTFKKRFSEPGGPRFETQGINFEDLFEQARSDTASCVNYEIVLSQEQARKGMEKELVRKGKRLNVKIPGGIKMGSRIRLTNALETTDGQPGDIIISIKVK
jgi:DnaJ-class molecular chaperone